MPAPESLKKALKADAAAPADSAQPGIEWPPEMEVIDNEPPRPLQREIPPAEPYPAGALPDRLRDAILDLQNLVQASLAMCAQSILAGACLAVQGQADVTIDGRIFPVSEFFLTIAQTGERKTATDTLACQAHREYQEELSRTYDLENREYQVALSAWKKCREQALSSKKSDYREKCEALKAIGPEPEEPMWPMFTPQESNYEGLFKLLQHGRPGIGIFSDEGGTLLGGTAFADENKLKMAAGLSKLWDGLPISKTRSGDGAQVLYGRRVCAHLMVQPGVAAAFLADGMFKDQGLLSRLLTTAPAPTAGTRFYRGTMGDVGLRAYHAKVSSILHAPLPVSPNDPHQLKPRKIGLAPDAKRLWIDFYNLIEKQLPDEKPLAPIRGFANKAGEHALRLAGILALYDNLDAGGIDYDHVSAGIALTEHYLHEALRMAEAANDDPRLAAAEKLREWSQQYEYVHSLQIYQLGPYAIRSAAAAKDAAAILAEHGWLRAVPAGMELDGAHRRNVWEVIHA